MSMNSKQNSNPWDMSKLTALTGKKRIPKNLDIKKTVSLTTSPEEKAELTSLFKEVKILYSKYSQNIHVQDMFDMVGNIHIDPAYFGSHLPSFAHRGRYVPLQDTLLINNKKGESYYEMLFHHLLLKKTIAHELCHKISTKAILLPEYKYGKVVNDSAALLQETTNDKIECLLLPVDMALDEDVDETESDFFYEHDFRLSDLRKMYEDIDFRDYFSVVINEAITDFISTSMFEPNHVDVLRKTTGYSHNMMLLFTAYFKEDISKFYWSKESDVELLSTIPKEKIVQFYRDMLEYILVGKVSGENNIISTELISMFVQIYMDSEFNFSNQFKSTSFEDRKKELVETYVVKPKQFLYVMEQELTPEEDITQESDIYIQVFKAMAGLTLPI
jgi:hypothetical protein